MLQQLQDYRQKTGIDDVPASPLQQTTTILMEQDKNRVYLHAIGQRCLRRNQM